MKQFLLKHNWWFYFILTYAISWSIWTIGNSILPEDLFIIALVLGVIAGILLIITKGRLGYKKEKIEF